MRTGNNHSDVVVVLSSQFQVFVPPFISFLQYNMSSDTESTTGKPMASSITPVKPASLSTTLLGMDAPVVMTGLELQQALSDALKSHEIASVDDTAHAAQGKFRKTPKRKHNEVCS